MKNRDVRMRGFIERQEVDAVLALLHSRIRPLGVETVRLEEAYGRVLAEDVVSEIDVPHFARAAVDGYAVQARETFGASSYNPIEFTLVGEVFPGSPFPQPLQKQQAVRIMTGAPLPPGADAVVMAEYAEERGGKVNIFQPITPYRNVGRQGEDIGKGEVVLRRGRRLRPQDVGVLASIQHLTPRVWRRPTVALLITGNELVKAGEERIEGTTKIVDSNSYVLWGLIEQYGGIPHRKGIIRDHYETIKRAMQEATEDVLLITGGSSVGAEDFAPLILSEIGELLVHGVAMRPSSPTGLGFLEDRPVFLLPGNPVSAMVAFEAFVGPTLQMMQGLEPHSIYPRVEGVLKRKVTSAIGRVDYVRVRFVEGNLVEPLRVSGASILSSTTRADGFIIVEKNSEGFDEGEKVEVYIYR
ncbi:MAG: molybdopterin molybdenumtransferase MoeA [Nitrospinota bacterium]|nr:MAG: molybdopterin molybdenumtransferase MoeA [Nitrospinota bacterium]